jgi:hypothetical protein
LTDIAAVIESLYSERLTLDFPLRDLNRLCPHVPVVESVAAPGRPGVVALERERERYVLRTVLADGSVVSWRRGDCPQAHAA